MWYSMWYFFVSYLYRRDSKFYFQIVFSNRPKRLIKFVLVACRVDAQRIACELVLYAKERMLQMTETKSDFERLRDELKRLKATLTRERSLDIYASPELELASQRRYLEQHLGDVLPTGLDDTTIKDMYAALDGLEANKKRLAKEREEQILGDLAHKVLQLPEPVVATPPEKPKRKIRLSQAFDAWMDYMRRMRWGDDSEIERTTDTSKNSVVGLLGDPYVCDITEETVKELKLRLSNLPPNVKTDHRAKSDLSVANEKTISYSSAKNKYQAFVNAFKHTPKDAKDWTLELAPLERPKLEIDRTDVDDDYGRTLNDAELAAIFDNEQFHAKQPATEPHKFWLPLLGLYTGARLGELCMLAVDDVLEVEGIQCIRIAATHDAQRFKTGTSKRYVALHPELIRIGFLDYVDAVRQRGYEFIFDNLNRVIRSRGKYVLKWSDTASRWFNRAFLESQVGIKEKGDRDTCYHSLRHSLIDRLRNKEVHVPTINAITGHKADVKVEGESASYGRSVKPEVSAKALRLLPFTDLTSSIQWDGQVKWRRYAKDFKKARERYNALLAQNKKD